MKKYNSVADICFVVLHDDKESPTEKELFDGLRKRLDDLEKNPGEILEACGLTDTQPASEVV